jgi:hypothetical protein
VTQSNLEVCTDIEEAKANGWTLYQKVFELIAEQNPQVRLASNVAMNLVAALIVGASPSLEQA